MIIQQDSAQQYRTDLSFVWGYKVLPQAKNRDCANERLGWLLVEAVAGEHVTRAEEHVMRADRGESGYWGKSYSGAQAVVRERRDRHLGGLHYSNGLCLALSFE
ncbi:MAG: hypothetical protein R3194_01795 [Limnobacter sp.]|nr:hypothetical protein [Limnobacter sp.]